MRRRLAAVWAWASNWRNGAVLAGSLLATVMLLVVIDAVQARGDAFDALDAEIERARESRVLTAEQVDRLSDRVDALVEAERSSAAEIADLRRQIDVLQRQIEQSGGQPVVPRSTTTTTQQRPAGGKGTTTTTSQQRPPPSTTTTAPPCSTVPVLGVCTP